MAAAAQVRRGLVLASKIVQKLANGVHFGASEEYLQRFTPLLAAHEQAMASFCEQLCESPPEPLPMLNPSMVRPRRLYRVAPVVCRVAT